MKIDHNLDMAKPIAEQLKTFAVAVNRFDPKPADYVYKFEECKNWQKDIIEGMAIAADEITNVLENHTEPFSFIYEPEVIRDIRRGYQKDILDLAMYCIINKMCETLVAFGDNNSLEEYDENEEN